ncbi:MAG: NAD(P)H-dependent glycerol-3-phosphate dehydrogenase [Patescibacteria group bacterium]
MKIGIYGIGSFGFAILQHISTNQLIKSSVEVIAYDRDKELINHLQKKRRHLHHHKKILIQENVLFTNNEKDVFSGNDVVIISITSSAIAHVLKKNTKFINKKMILLNTTKALDKKTARCFSEIVGGMPVIRRHACPLAVIAGGTIASDLFHHEPLGVDIGCGDPGALKVLKKLFLSDNLNVYTTSDVRGIEYAGAFKNVISILAGIVNGCGFSYGSETHLITRAAFETTRLLKKKISIDPYTFSMYSQCWGNDLWLSCTGNTRNREFGMLIGKGFSPKNALHTMSSQRKTVEGVNTVQALKKFNLSPAFPIFNGIYRIVVKNQKPKKVILELMASNQI